MSEGEEHPAEDAGCVDDATPGSDCGDGVGGDGGGGGGERCGGAAGGHAAVDEAGADDGDVHAGVVEVVGEAMGPGVEAGFGCAVGVVGGADADAGNAGEDDEVAVVLAAHDAGDGGAGGDRAGGVGDDHVAGGDRVGVVVVLGAEHAGRDDDDVEVADVGDDLVDDRGVGVDRGGVPGDDVDVAVVGCVECRRSGVAGFGIATGEHDVAGGGCDEFGDDGEADLAGAAEQHDGLVVTGGGSHLVS